MLFRPQDYLQKLPHKGEQFIDAFRRPHMRAVLYAPRGHDPQTPHKADEVYIIVAGTGKLWVEGETFPFEVGDMLYVPAGRKHRFVDFSDDLVTWVVFERAQTPERWFKAAFEWIRARFQGV